MSILSDVRVAINDNSTSQRFTDAEITSFVTQALGDINGWGETTYVYTDLDDGTAPIRVYQLTLLRSRVIIGEADLSNIERYTKFVTQDTSVDPTSVAKALTTMIWNIKKELEQKIRYWIGIETGVTLQTSGDELGGFDLPSEA